jgi:hypothetical protein
MTTGLKAAAKHAVQPAGYLTFKQVMATTQLGETYLRGQIRKGALRCRRAGKALRFRLSDVDAFMDTLAEPAAAVKS